MVSTAAFNWFVTVVFGFIVRIDLYGASSFVRWLGIKPALYTAMLSFFRASSWKLHDILWCWWHIVIERCPLPKIDGRLLLVGDGIKICKEAEKMRRSNDYTKNWTTRAKHPISMVTILHDFV